MIWADGQHKSGLTVLYGSGSLATVRDKLAGHSVVGVSYSVESTPQGPMQEPGSGPYNTVADKVFLIFQTASGTNVTVTLIGPNDDILMADNKTVDSSTIGDVITAVLAVVTDASGNAVTSYVTGYRASPGQREYA